MPMTAHVARAAELRGPRDDSICANGSVSAQAPRQHQCVRQRSAVLS